MPVSSPSADPHPWRAGRRQPPDGACGDVHTSQATPATRLREEAGFLTQLRTAVASIVVTWMFVAPAMIPLASRGDDAPSKPPAGTPANKSPAGNPLSPLDNASPAKHRYSGKVVRLSDALTRRGIKCGSEMESHIVLETDDGRLLPILADWRGRAFYQDARLRDRKVTLIAHRRDDLGYLQPLMVFTYDEVDRPQFTDYWCDVCSIPMYEIKPCDCCQGDIRLRFTAQSPPEDVPAAGPKGRQWSDARRRGGASRGELRIAADGGRLPGEADGGRWFCGRRCRMGGRCFPSGCGRWSGRRRWHRGRSVTNRRTRTNPPLLRDCDWQFERPDKVDRQLRLTDRQVGFGVLAGVLRRRGGTKPQVTVHDHILQLLQLQIRTDGRGQMAQNRARHRGPINGDAEGRLVQRESSRRVVVMSHHIGFDRTKRFPERLASGRWNLDGDLRGLALQLEPQVPSELC